MKIIVLTVTLHAPWVQSLKQKRSETKGLIARLKAKFNLSVAEVATQDAHKTITLGLAGIAADSAQADSIAQNTIHYLQSITDAQIVQLDQEVL